MDKISKITAYVPVSVETNLAVCQFERSAYHWLPYTLNVEKRENVFVFSPAELEKLLDDTWRAAVLYASEFGMRRQAALPCDPVAPDKDQFLNQLINPI